MIDIMVIFSDIFWEKVLWTMNKAQNTDAVLRIFEENILKWNGFVLAELQG